MSDDLLALLTEEPGEVSAVKGAMVEAFRAAMPKGVDVYYGVPATRHLPCVCVGEVEITPSRTFGNEDGSGMEEMVFTVTVFTASAEDEDGQRMLDALISRKGPVRRALWAMRGEPGEPALGGAADDIALGPITGYGMVAIGDNQSEYGAILSVRVIVS